MNVITEDYYLDIVKKNDDLIQLILEKTNEFAFIIGRCPIGECDETDFEIVDDKFLVQFESFSCGESDYDTYMLPMEFIFDEDYPKKYAKIYAEEQIRLKIEKLRIKEEKENKINEQREQYDRKEYTRLKNKYE